MGKILLPAQFDGYSNRKDRTVMLKFVTQEMTPEDIAKIHGMIDTFGYMYFKAETELTQAEKSELDALDTDLNDNPVSKSKRMKNILYRTWEKQPSGFQSFKDYYAWRMDMLNKQLKDKLQDLDDLDKKEK